MEAGRAKDANAAIGRSAGKIGAATLLSHLFGMARDVLFAFLFGTSLYADAFNLAFSVPQFLRRLFGEAVMNAAFIPVFTQHRLARGDREAWRFGSSALVALVAVLLPLVTAGVIAAPFLVRLYAHGWRDDPERIGAAIHLTRLLFPYLLFVGPAVLVMGILNGLKHFTVPALSPVVWNAGIIVFALVAMAMPGGGTARIDLFCAGVLVGSLGQLVVQLPTLWRQGFRFVPPIDLRSPELGAVASLMVPGILGLAVIQINVVVDTFFATLLPEGSVTALRLGNRVMLLPIAVFATAIASASLPSLATQVVEEGMDRAKETVAYTLRMLVFLLLPSTAGLMVLRRPIIRLLFVRGAFDASRSLDMTATALLLYAAGLVAYGGVRVLSQLYFATRDTKTPVLVGAVAMATNVLFDLLLYRPLAVGGLALATALAGMTNFLLLLVLLARRHGPFRGGRLGATALRVGAASVLMGAVVYGTGGLLAPATSPAGPSLPAQLLHVGGSIVCGAVTYIAAAFLLCRREMREVTAALFRRPLS